MKKYPLVSIIIPYYVVSDRFYQEFKKFEELDYPHIEILVVCDKKGVKLPKLKKVTVKMLVTGKKQTGPAVKRDIALKKAKGEICAFIDDDAYPDPKWLKNAVRIFDKYKVAAVGGPGLTPPEDSYWEQLTGLVYGSFFCGGFAKYRFVKGKRQYVVDFPAYNLFIKTDVLKAVGGYGNDFYGGEDTFLCLKLIKNGHKIMYDPNVVVYHHRRPLYTSYLKQIANIGKHRGYFAKKFPETSRQFFYFIPSILTIGFFILLIASFFNQMIAVGFLTVILLFIVVAFLSVIKYTNPLNAMLVAFGIILTHFSYGWAFIKGLNTPYMKR